jgi:hypothetical protein
MVMAAPDEGAHAGIRTGLLKVHATAGLFLLVAGGERNN